MIKPQVLYLTTTNHILRYFTSTLDYSIFYSINSTMRLSGYVDRNWTKNLFDGRSTTRFVFMLRASSITWLSKKQPTVTLSSFEAEYSWPLERKF